VRDSTSVTCTSYTTKFYGTELQVIIKLLTKNLKNIYFGTVISEKLQHLKYKEEKSKENILA